MLHTSFSWAGVSQSRSTFKFLTNLLFGRRPTLSARTNADNADVSFEVASGDNKQLFCAHGQILAARCPTLASLAKGCDPNTPIAIEDVPADVFRMLLRFIYGGEVPSKEVIIEQAKTIIRAADRFECTGLKLAVEAELATAGITTENAAGLFLFADATNCALLKEATMEYFVTNAQDVMATEGFAQVKESPAVLTELMTAMAVSIQTVSYTHLTLPTKA